MKRNTIFGKILTLVIISMLPLTFNIQQVKSEPTTIYVDDDNVAGPWDGTPEHPYQNITSALEYAVADDTVFVFSGTYNEKVVVDESLTLIGENRKTTIIDGGGYGNVIYVTANYVTVANFTILNGGNGGLTGSGVSLISSSFNTIFGNNITNNSKGIYLDGSSDNSISGNTITNNSGGIYFGYSSKNTVSGNDVTSHDSGISLYCSANNTLRDNHMDNNTRNFDISGSSISDFVNDVDTSNTVDGKPVYYWINQQDKAVPVEAGYVALVNSTNITVEGLELKNNRPGLLLAYTNNSRITDNNVTSNEFGIYLIGSSNNSISGNNITNNDNGIWVVYSYSNIISENNITNNEPGGIILGLSNLNTVSGNTITNSTLFGLALSQSSNNSISGNNITNNIRGLALMESSSYNIVSANNITNNIVTGIYIVSPSEPYSPTSYNTISGNNITNNTRGIFIEEETSYNTIFGNNITNNSEYGIYLRDSSDNLIYHNNFVANTNQVYTENSVSVWDDSYPSGGNYWSDYTGVDLYSGPNQDEPGSDGIGDTPYDIDEYNTDRYPFMNPWKYEVTITAHCSNENENVSVDIVMDGSPTAYTTRHTFTRLIGSHTFTVPSTDPQGHPFYSWSTGERSTTLTVSSSGTYTAYYYYYTSPVGGIVTPIDKLGLLAPYIGLASTILVATAATAVYVKRVRRRKEKQ